MSSGKVIKEFRDLDLKIGGIYDLPLVGSTLSIYPLEYQRVKILELDWEDAICENEIGEIYPIWLGFFEKAIKLKIAGNWKKNA